MFLYHVTTSGVLPFILEEGVRPDLAQTARQESWLVESRRLLWAFLHVAKRHNAPLDRLMAVRVKVPAGKLRKRGEGVWTSDLLIPPGCIQSVTSLSLKTRRAR